MSHEGHSRRSPSLVVFLSLQHTETEPTPVNAIFLGKSGALVFLDVFRNGGIRSAIRQSCWTEAVDRSREGEIAGAAIALGLLRSGASSA